MCIRDRVNGVCERCGSPVVRKVKSEWMLKITDYADKLIEGLDHVDYIERVKTQQKNWKMCIRDRYKPCCNYS